MTKELNLFTSGLSNLFEALSDYTRKRWGNMLSISEAAISQWMTGKTVPSPENIRAIISLIRKQKLNPYQQGIFDEFMALMELPAQESLGDFSTKTGGESLSNYAIKNLEYDCRRSIYSLYYDLKCELYNQQLREIDILKKVLQEKILNMNVEDNNSVHLKLSAAKQLQKSYSDKSNRKSLETYVNTLKKIHLSYNHSLKHTLTDLNFTSADNIDFEIKIIPKNKKEEEKQREEHLPIIPISSIAHLTAPKQENLDFLKWNYKAKAFNSYNELYCLRDKFEHSHRIGSRLNSFSSNLITWDSLKGELNKKNNREVIINKILHNTTMLSQTKLIRLTGKGINKIRVNGTILFFGFDADAEYIVDGKRSNNLLLFDVDDYRKDVSEVTISVQYDCYALIIDSFFSKEKVSKIDIKIDHKEDTAEKMSKYFDKISGQKTKKHSWISEHCLVRPEDTNGLYSVELLHLGTVSNPLDHLNIGQRGTELIIPLNGDVNYYWVDCKLTDDELMPEPDCQISHDTLNSSNTHKAIPDILSRYTGNPYCVSGSGEKASIALLIRQHLDSI